MGAAGGGINVQYESEWSIDVPHGNRMWAHNVRQAVEIKVPAKMMEIADVWFEGYDSHHFWVTGHKNSIIPEIRADIEEDVATMLFNLVVEVSELLVIVATDQTHMAVDVVPIIDEEKRTSGADDLKSTLPRNGCPSLCERRQPAA